MRTVSLPWIAALGVALTPPAAHAGGTPAWAKAYMADYSARALEKAHARIPAWARRYSKNCDACHYPAPPRLNAEGVRFKWQGYRYADDMNEKVDVEKVQNYISFRARGNFTYSKTENQLSSYEFAPQDATLFYGGPFGKNFGAFFELEREAENSVELVANIQTVWGKEKSFGGFRFGQFHWMLREGLAGFDRPTGIGTPNPVNGKLTASIPFKFSNDQIGLEAYYVAGNNRVSGEVLNGINSAGIGDEGDTDRNKDFVFIDQYLLDGAGSGIMAVGYYGSVDTASTTTHFWRLGVTANKFVSNFEAQGAFLYGKDLDLPTGVGGFPTPENKGLGYWFYGGYMFPKTSFTAFGRYEFVDPNTDVDNNATTRWVLGGVLPVGLPQYLRLSVEGTLDVPQATGAPKKYGATAQVMLNF